MARPAASALGPGLPGARLGAAAAFKAEETGEAISRENVYLKHATPSQNDTTPLPWAPRSGRCGCHPVQAFPASLFGHGGSPALRAYFLLLCRHIFFSISLIGGQSGKWPTILGFFRDLSTWKEAKVSAGTIKRDTIPALNRDPAVPVSEARPFATRRRCVAAKGGGPERKGEGNMVRFGSG